MPQLPLLTFDTIDVDQLENNFRSREHGAVVTFQGVVRQDSSDEGMIDHLLYECYEPMAEKELKRLLNDLARRWPKSSVLIQHRLGRVNVGETSVFIAVSSPHRAHAFEACRHAIDRIKTSVPIWKKDVFTDGQSRWTTDPHGAMLLADEAITLQNS